jgi:hypothetical protein
MRDAIAQLDRQFAELHHQTSQLITRAPADRLYSTTAESPDSVGDQALRSAAAIEQSFGGLTANLWDDPFEWTLPENLNTPAKVLEYLSEVEETRQRAFQTFKSDEDLQKQIMTPAGTVELRQFLLDTFDRARHHLQRAIAALDLLSTNY